MKKRIAILGGGMGGLTAAYELTRRAGWQDRYEITVYQMGWRVGGKGASGVNLEAGGRIEEHGLHVLWGFYENVFRMLREVYAELGRAPDAPLSTLDQAVEPHDRVVIPERIGDAWSFWDLRAPRHSGTPGTMRPGGEPWDYAPALLRTAREALESLVGTDASGREARQAALRRELPTLRALLGWASRSDGEAGALSSALRAVAQRLSLGAMAVSRGVGRFSLLLGVDLAELIASGGELSEEDRRAWLWLVRRYLSHLLRHAAADDADGRRAWMITDLALTILRGLVVDGLALPPRDWSKLDDESLRAWLRRHGAEPATVDSALIDAWHAAAYAHGLEVGAGSLLHAILRMVFTYQGALFYRMTAGMGEVVFAPLFEVLTRRGVRFEFFHRVERLEADPEVPEVARVVMQRQATPRQRYWPLIDVDGLPCWPTQPLFEQLVEGDALHASGEDLENTWSGWAGAGEVTLEAGRDFDAVVLAIAPGALPFVCGDMLDDPRFSRLAGAVAHVKTTQTQSAQLWMSAGLDRLGWSGPAPTVIPFAQPIDTWADMTHLLARERWPAGQVGHLSYLTARLDDDEPVPPLLPDEYPERQRARVRQNVEGWLSSSAGSLWPGSTSTSVHGGFTWGWLHDPEHRSGPDRLAAQYWCATKNPSDRYVLPLVGTSKHRISTDETGATNLLVAGDWVRTAMNLGCLEAAVMGGLQAARALDPGARLAIGDWTTRADGQAAATPHAITPPPAAPRRELPRFVHRDGDLLATPPIGLDVTVYQFVLRADLGRLTEMCNQHLNLRGDTHYRPLSPLVVLYCSSVNNYPLTDPIGWVPETDYGIWVPLVAGKHVRGRFRPSRVAFYTPYIWVSNDVALTNGRLYFGFKKDLGVMTLPPSPQEANSFSLDTMVIPRFAPDQSIEQRRLISIQRQSGEAAAPLDWARSVVEGGGAALTALRSLAGEASQGGLDFIGQLGNDARRGMRKVFLKQMPDVVDGRRACYQAVVEAMVEVTGDLRSGPLPGPWRCSIERYDSHRLVDTLGLATALRRGDHAEIVPLAAAWASFRARVGGGEIIWEARLRHTRGEMTC